MAFLEKLGNRAGYDDANIYQFERRTDRPRRTPAYQIHDPGVFGPQSGGMVDMLQQNVARKSGGDPRNPTAGLLGIQNTTGFAQGEGTPNLVYDQGPEQFAQEMKLRNRELDIRKMQAEGVLENNRVLNETRQQNANSNSERAAVARMRAQNPNLVFQRVPGGNLIALDPATGQAIDTGISSGMMTQEGAINLRNQGQKDIQGMRNEGALAQIGARNQGNMNLEELQQTGALDLLLRRLAAERNNTIFKEGANTFRTRMRESEDPLLGPVERGPSLPPEIPGRELPPRVPTAEQTFRQSVPSGLNLGSGGNMEAIGSLQLKPGQMQGFGSKPGEFTAAPGQFTPGTPANEAAKTGQSENVKPDPSNPEMSLVTFPDGKTRRVPNSEVASVVASFGTPSVKGTKAGETGKTPAGKTTGKAAGKV